MNNIMCAHKPRLLRPAEAQRTRRLGLGYKLCAVIPVASQRTHGTTFRALKVTSQVEKPGAESPVYDCIVCRLYVAPTQWWISTLFVPRETWLNSRQAKYEICNLVHCVSALHSKTGANGYQTQPKSVSVSYLTNLCWPSSFGPQQWRWLQSGPGGRWQLWINICGKPAARRCCCRSTGQTDGRTPYRYTDAYRILQYAGSVKICISTLLTTLLVI